MITINDPDWWPSYNKRPIRIQKNRLLKLADMLEANAENRKGMKFDIKVVAMTAPDWNDGYLSPGLDCGTTGCAIGLAMVSKQFERAGLSYKFDPKSGSIEPLFKGNKATFAHAARKTFGLTSNECDYLFTPWMYKIKDQTGARGERAVAKRIRDFLNKEKYTIKHMMYIETGERI